MSARNELTSDSWLEVEETAGLSLWSFSHKGENVTSRHKSQIKSINCHSLFFFQCNSHSNVTYWFALALRHCHSCTDWTTTTPSHVIQLKPLSNRSARFQTWNLSDVAAARPEKLDGRDEKQYLKRWEAERQLSVCHASAGLSRLLCLLAQLRRLSEENVRFLWHSDRVSARADEEEPSCKEEETEEKSKQKVL